MAGQPEPARSDGCEIVHEDDELIVVNKPPGIPTDRTRDPNRTTLIDLVEDRSPSTIDLRAVHRLDSATSGLVLFARSKRVAAELGELFRNRRVGKAYVAWVSGTPATTTWVTRSFLRHDRGKTRSVRAGGKTAITDFSVITARARITEIDVRPRTGRTHQIRAHLAEGGHPILGDALYAPPEIAAYTSRLMLHARHLEFQWRDNSWSWVAPPNWTTPF